MPKYWLDFSGLATDDAVLHCRFRSSDPTFYESYYILDHASADITDSGVVFHRITDSFGFDRSDWFERLSVRQEGDMLIMEVERNEKTLAGGSEDNVLTGEYWMEPMGVVRADPAGTVYKAGELPRLALRPLEDGPYTPDRLGQLARVYYFEKTGFYPTHVETDVNQDGTVTVHLFEVVVNDGVRHTATSAWYTVDAYGVGTDDIFGDAVRLVPAGQ
jgi:hypothetical protein